MNKDINTLVQDIYSIVSKRGGWSNELIQEFGENCRQRLNIRYGSETEDKKPTLRLSRMGDQCPRALWYSIHYPEKAEPLPPWATIKYIYGDLIESLTIALAKASGHRVEGEQDEVHLDGVVGHRDCVIDGCIVDVKSCSSLSFEKFKNKTIAQSDSFGYLDQLDGYLVACSDDPLVHVKDRGYLLAVDKQLGHMCLYEHIVREAHIRARVKQYKRIVEADNPPECTCKTIPIGQSGNIGLDLKASYNPFKYCCFPNLRTFLYAKGPVYLTKVVRVPDVIEIDREGKVVYNG